MMKLPSSFVSFAVTVTLLIVIIISISSFPSTIPALGSGSTLTVSYGSATVCAVVAAQSTQSLLYYSNGTITAVEPNISYSYIFADQNFFCAVRSNGYSLLCWDTTGNFSFDPKRIYYTDTVLLNNLAIGDDHVCATTIVGEVICWRGNISNSTLPSKAEKFRSISSESGFSCGILMNTRSVCCWGSNSIANQIKNDFGSKSMMSIVVGRSHVCGIDLNGFVVCYGSNESGQLNVPSNSSDYTALALGDSHGCAIRLNGSVTCWRERGEYSVDVTEGISFQSIVSGSNFTCGLISGNFSVMCWGPGYEPLRERLCAMAWGR